MPFPFLILQFLAWTIAVMIITRRSNSPDVMLIAGASGIVCSLAVLASLILYWIMLLRITRYLRRCNPVNPNPSSNSSSALPASPRE